MKLKKLSSLTGILLMTVCCMHAQIKITNLNINPESDSVKANPGGGTISAPLAPKHYQIANIFPLPGNGGWDYLVSEPETSRLFISHGDEVNVLNENSGELLGTIPETKGVHGITLAEDLNMGFISNGKDSSVTIFDLKTLAPITKIQVTGINPDCILYDPFSHHVFVFNGTSKNVTVMSAKKIIATIPLAGKPEFAVTNEKGKIFVNIENKNEISVINTTSLKVDTNWSIAPGEQSSGLAIDLNNNRLFAVCDNKLMVILNAATGEIVSTPTIGEGPDAVTYDPKLKRLFTSNGEGTMTIVQQQSPNNYMVLENVPTRKGARTMALDTKTHHMFLAAAEYGDKPEPTADSPHPRAAIKDGSFVILDVALR
jgi:DNA-binding beta-propeller fold protein YncE